jgi:hypothetical protein
MDQRSANRCAVHKAFRRSETRGLRLPKDGGDGEQILLALDHLPAGEKRRLRRGTCPFKGIEGHWSTREEGPRYLGGQEGGSQPFMLQAVVNRTHRAGYIEGQHEGEPAVLRLSWQGLRQQHCRGERADKRQG